MTVQLEYFDYLVLGKYTIEHLMYRQRYDRLKKNWKQIVTENATVSAATS